MTEKRFQLNKDIEWWFVKDNTIKVNEFGYRDDVIGEDKYRGLKQELTEEETVELLNELHEENYMLKKSNESLQACQYRRIQKLESEKEELGISIKLFEDDVKRLTEEISYWKHRVSSLLFILSQFDNEKVKKLLEELNEREEI